LNTCASIIAQSCQHSRVNSVRAGLKCKTNDLTNSPLVLNALVIKRVCGSTEVRRDTEGVCCIIHVSYELIAILLRIGLPCAPKNENFELIHGMTCVEQVLHAPPHLLLTVEFVLICAKDSWFSLKVATGLPRLMRAVIAVPFARERLCDGFTGIIRI